MSSYFRSNDNDADDSQAPPTTSNLIGGDVGAEDTEDACGAEDDEVTEADGATPIYFEPLLPPDVVLNTVS